MLAAVISVLPAVAAQSDHSAVAEMSASSAYGGVVTGTVRFYQVCFVFAGDGTHLVACCNGTPTLRHASEHCGSCDVQCVVSHGGRPQTTHWQT